MVVKGDGRSWWCLCFMFMAPPLFWLSVIQVALHCSELRCIALLLLFHSTMVCHTSFTERQYALHFSVHETLHTLCTAMHLHSVYWVCNTLVFTGCTYCASHMVVNYKLCRLHTGIYGVYCILHNCTTLHYSVHCICTRPYLVHCALCTLHTGVYGVHQILHSCTA